MWNAVDLHQEEIKIALCAPAPRHISRPLYDAFTRRASFPNRIPMPRRTHSAPRRQERLPQIQQGMTSMTALLVENFKLIVLFVLIGSIIGLSHLSGTKAKPARQRRRRGYGRPASARL